MNCLDFGRFLAGYAREKSSNCVSPDDYYDYYDYYGIGSRCGGGLPLC